MTKTMEANGLNREERRRLLYKKKCLGTIFGCSIRQIELMVNDGRTPKPFYIGNASPRWRAEDIDAWLEKLATEANQDGAK